MRVVLPDSSELELPRARRGWTPPPRSGRNRWTSGVVRSNGRVQDLRAPLEDGQPIQILTTRDTDDPDALAVLRHSAAHLLAEAVRRLYPGVKIAIGPPVENGFYYDFEFPSRLRGRARADRGGDPARPPRAAGAEEISRDEARRRFEEEGEPYKVELVDTAEGDISLYTQGEFTDLCRGPHLQDSKPIKALKLTGLAGAYWRGDEKNTQLTRIYGTAFYSEDDLKAYLERIEEAQAAGSPAARDAARPLHFSEHSPGMPLWHPKGMVDLARSRRSAGENAKRGYLEVKTPLLYDAETFISGHFPKTRRHSVPSPDVDGQLGLKPMNASAHAPVRQRAPELPRPAAACRRRCTETSDRELHGLLRAARHAGRRAHLLHRRPDPEEIADVVDYGQLPLRAVRDDGERGALHAPENKLGTDEEWDFTEGALRSALKRNEMPYEIAEGEGFYGPKIDLTRGRDGRNGDGGRSSSIRRCRRASASRTWAPTTPSTRCTSSVRCLARLSGSSGFCRALRGAFCVGLAPVQLRIIPVGEDHREAARIGREALGLPGGGRRLDETVGKRIRNAEVEKIPYTVVYGDRVGSRRTLAVRERGGEQSTRSLDELVKELAASL